MKSQSQNNNPHPHEYGFAALFIIAIVLMFILNACSPRIVEHVRYQHDTTYVQHFQVDSVFKRDSIYIREKNDTVYQYVERIRDRYRLIHDTTYMHKVDTVFRDRPVVKEVEKALTPWQNFRMTLGSIFIFATLLALAIWAIRKFVLKK